MAIALWSFELLEVVSFGWLSTMNVTFTSRDAPEVDAYCDAVSGRNGTLVVPEGVELTIPVATVRHELQLEVYCLRWSVWLCTRYWTHRLALLDVE